MNCIVCGKTNWVNHLEILKKCNVCGFTRAHDRYFSFTPKRLYDQKYFDQIDYKGYEIEKPAISKNSQDRLVRIRKYKKLGSLLDVGCAYGYFLSFAERFFKTTGIDINPDITKKARENSHKSKILTGDLTNKRLDKDLFDVVCLFDTIEHLKNPDRYVKKIYSLLRRHGILVIETGDIGSLLARLQGEKWRLITPPTHLNYFSRKTLEILLKKNSLRILEVNYVPFTRTVNQIFYRLTKNSKILNLLSPWLTKTITVNTYDLLFVIAQKINRR